MLSKHSPIALVWLKRDLRLEDHEALTVALENHKLVLILYVAEDFLLEDPHCSERHLNFIKESIQDLNTQLRPFNTEVLALQGEPKKPPEKNNFPGPKSSIHSMAIKKSWSITIS